MEMSEKIEALRKKQNLTQEELAEKVGVSVDKIRDWENGPCVPNLNELILLSDIFDVTADFLLKETASEEEIQDKEADNINTKVRFIDDAKSYLHMIKTNGSKLALGLSLLILSPSFVMFFMSFSSIKNLNISTDLTIGLGFSAMIIMFAAALAIIVTNSLKLKKFSFLKTEPIALNKSDKQSVEDIKEKYERIWNRTTGICIALIVMSVAPVFIAVSFIDKTDIYMYWGFIMMAAFTALGVYLLFSKGIMWSAIKRLLEEDEYTREKKEERRRNTSFTKTYWIVTISIYFLLSILTSLWYITWVILPVAFILYRLICYIKRKNRKNRKKN